MRLHFKMGSIDTEDGDVVKLRRDVHAHIHGVVNNINSAGQGSISRDDVVQGVASFLSDYVHVVYESRGQMPENGIYSWVSNAIYEWYAENYLNDNQNATQDPIFIKFM